MPQGQNARRYGHIDREYQSRRCSGRFCLSYGKIGRWITKRHERAATRRQIHDILSGKGDR